MPIPPPVILGAAVVGAAAVGFVAVPVALGGIGFTAAGPVAGSAAATWMSSIGVVQAGSVYSVVQSVAMGGTAAIAVKTASSALFAAGAAVAAVFL